MFHVKHSIDILILYSSLHPRVFLRRIILSSAYQSFFGVFFFSVYFSLMCNFFSQRIFSASMCYFFEHVIIFLAYQPFFGVFFFLQCVILPTERLFPFDVYFFSNVSSFLRRIILFFSVSSFLRHISISFFL